MRSLGTIPNWTEPIRKLVKKLQVQGDVRACYEAGPTGYCLYWQLTQPGVECEVIAPLFCEESGLVRGSPRRIMTLRFRTAYIRVIYGRVTLSAAFGY